MVVRRMMIQVIKVLKRELNELGGNITLEQYSLLHAISQKKQDVVQQDMAEILNKDKSAILRLIDSLESKGLAVRSNDPQDRRKNVLTVTEQGKESIDQFITVTTRWNENIIQGISQSDLNTFYSVIEQIKSNAEKL